MINLFPRLIQLVIDGYNVCIFAYGQTGSGKTFTMVGDKDQKNPGIMPRSFNAIFDLMRENKPRFDFKVTLLQRTTFKVKINKITFYVLLQVSAYMLELYNDKLQDLLVSQAGEANAQTQAQGPARRVEIKRNRKGVVFAQGAETKEASSAQELYALFQQACANRHISATSELSILRSVTRFKQGQAKWLRLILLAAASVKQSYSISKWQAIYMLREESEKSLI